MAGAKRKTTRSETLTIRLDPKTRFMLDFVSRMRGQTVTTVVDRAIFDAAQKEYVGFDREDNWRAFWSVSEGERSLRMYEEPELRPTYEEDKRLAFAKEHWPFFFVDRPKDDRDHSYRRPFIDILWPQIDEFIEIHDQKQKDYFAAGKAMQGALREAKVNPPDWPISKTKNAQIEEKNNSRDLDDEIPF